ncbi:RNA-binding domain-containing protein [Parabacteroides sp.]
MAIPVNLEDLLQKNKVESNRIEFKEGWNPDRIYRSICAFANDFDNTGGGYILIGVEEENGQAKRPVKGLPVEQLDKIQREILQFNNLMQPVYFPKLFLEEVDGRTIAVIWAMAGQGRPYKCPENITHKNKVYQYYIRYGSNSIVAKGEMETELISLSNQTPFDDRPNHKATLEDISLVLIRDYLVKVKSKLALRLSDYTLKDILDQMDLLSGTTENWYIKNLALMMFCDSPEKFFPYTQVDIVVFPEGKVNNPDNFIEAPAIKGPIPYIIMSTLNYLRTNVIKERVQKLKQREESIRTYNYPYQALEEAVVNALYHRDYQVQEPVEITIEPNCISILSYSGPDRSISMEAICKAQNLRSRRYKNRRLGDYLKELDLTEGRGTGIPTIQKELKNNGSGPAALETDEGRSYFLIDIPCHPDFKPTQVGDIQLGHKLQMFTKKILDALSEKAMSRSDILDMINVPDNWYNKGVYLNPLISNGLIKPSQEKKRSPKQSYEITERGLEYLRGLE